MKILSHTILKPFIIKVSVLDYFPILLNVLYIYIYIPIYMYLLS